MECTAQKQSERTSSNIILELINSICFDRLGKILQISRLDAFLRDSKSFNATFVYVELL
jgi:hypothetical protein